MSIEKNKAIVRDFVEQVFNEGNTESLADYCAPGSFLAGGLAGQIKVIRTAFPDYKLVIDTLLAEADKVVLCATARGTNSGALGGFPAFGKIDPAMPPTHKPIVSNATYVFTLKEGKVLRLAWEFDQLGILKQLGWVISPPHQTEES